jgi:AcrR family transcriptional regulator
MDSGVKSRSRVPRAKRQIADALVSLLKHESVDDITIKQLVATSGVNHSTFYYHFKGIDDVFEFLMNEFVDAFREFLNWKNLDEFSKEESETSITRIARFILANLDVFSELMASPFGNEFTQRLIDVMSDIFKHHVVWWWRTEDGEVFRLSHQQQAYFGAFISYSIMAFISEWRDRGYEETPEELSDLYVACNYNLVDHVEYV